MIAEGCVAEQEIIFIGLRVSAKLVKALDIYIADMVRQQPPRSNRFNRQTAIRQLLTEILRQKGISVEDIEAEPES